MRSVWKCASIALVATASAGACQLVSGLDDLEATSDASPEGASTSGPGASSGGSSSGAGGAGGGGQGGGGQGGAGQGGAGAGGTGGGPVVSCDALTCPTVFIADTGVPVEMLAIDGTYIYWGFSGDPNVNPPGGSVRRAPLSDPNVPAHSIMESIRPIDLYVSKAKNLIFWTDFEGIPRIWYIGTDLTLGPFSAPYTGTNPFLSLTATPSGSYLLWGVFSDNPLLLQEAPPPMSAPAVVSGAIEKTQSEIFAAGNLVYYHGLNAIHCNSLDVAETCAQQNIMATNPSGFGLEVAGNSAFWTNKLPNGSVWTSVIEGGNIPVTLVTFQSYPTYITTDQKNIYWATNGSASCPGNEGAVRTKPLMPVDPLNQGSVLAGQIPCPSNFVHDESGAFYWGAGKTIYKMQKSAP